MQDAWVQSVNRNQETALPKIGMQPIRRQQLIQATMAAIDEVGLADATVLRIARHAGVSAGIISHYFGGKDGLLEATIDRKSTRLNSSHVAISYAVFCLNKK